MGTDPPIEVAETRALVISLITTAVLGCAAVAWGIISASRMVLFDGVYMLAGIVLVGASLMASRVASAGPTEQFPFGRSGATPLAVALQGAALLGTLIYGAADAIKVIASGGSDAAAGAVLGYGIVTAAISVLVMLWLRSYARRSPLARAELVGWRAGALLSLVVALGGALAMVLTSRGRATLAGYVDPVLVLVACAVIAPLALGLVREGLMEILEAAPPADVRAQIAEVVDAARARFELGEASVRSTNLGRRLYVEVDFFVPRETWRVDDEDEVRRFVDAGLTSSGHDVWATVTLSTDAVGT